jgi:cation:H+ antiporter
MRPIAGVLLPFLVSAVFVVLAGTVLARAGDVIAARTKLGGVWVGSVFLAVATSLPELTTDVAAVKIGALDLAAGDLFGSSLANMLILAILNLVPGGLELFRKAALEHALYAALAIIVTAVAAITILAKPATTWLGIGPGALLIAAIYLAGWRALYRRGALAREAAQAAEMRGVPASGEVGRHSIRPAMSLLRAIAEFLAATVVILVAAPRFAEAAENLAEITGLGSTFIGTWLVGFSTSLPELVTGLAAVRLGAFDLAVGNLFGSNAFNMTVFAVLDAVYPQGAILSAVSTMHVVSALAAIVLMALGVAALVYRAQGRWALLEPSSGLIILGYFFGLWLILQGAA